MIKQAISMIKNLNGFGLAALVILLGLSSCAEGQGGDALECVKCVDNKPAATPFSNTVNALNHNISLDQARTMVHNFGSKKDTLLASKYRGSNALPLYETFNLKAIDSILCQPKTVGFRIYMALDNQQKVRFVLVGVDGDGKDIIQRTDANPSGIPIKAADASIMVKEAGQRWP